MVTAKQEHRGGRALSDGLSYLEGIAPDIAGAIRQELIDQRTTLKMIASENYSSIATQLAMGNWMTDKYSEGYPAHRFYAGCDNVDIVEQAAADAAKALFGADHAYVQPHSGADANIIAFWAILVTRIQDVEVQRLGMKSVNELSLAEYERIRQLMVNQKVMGMSLNSGGHLTHGFRHNLSAKMMQSVSYDVDAKTGLLDYDVLAKQVEEEKPLILIAGYSAYPRRLNFARLREIADSVSATLLVDMAHFSGLVAGKVFTGEYDPVPYADIVTSTTHKTLRGPRGGLILCKEPYKEAINKGCPLAIGGPLPHVMAAKAIAFREAQEASFSAYAHRIVENAQALAAALSARGIPVLTGGTDNHLLLFNVAEAFGLTGKQAEAALRRAHITTNRNAIPFDVNGAWYTSGIRVGTAALTTRGLTPPDMAEIAENIADLLEATRPTVHPETGAPSRVAFEIDETRLAKVESRVASLLERYPLYPEIDV
jgi:glycine hydroxymethyltransferase